MPSRPPARRPPLEDAADMALSAPVLAKGVLGRNELKKHVGAVHVRGKLSLLQRKLANVLLLNAYDELPRPDVFEHAIRIRTLAEAAGFDSNDHEHLREALEALVDLKVKWNTLSRGEEEWGVSSFLAQAVTRGGVCRYAYAPDLRKKLYNPEVYARINLAVQERFGSGYALALYENCVRFRKVGTTGWIALDDWRGLLGVEEGQYAAFKYLHRGVLKPAIDEVNQHSDIHLSMETRRERRRVVALKFSVSENVQMHLSLQTSRGSGPLLGSQPLLNGKPLPDPRALAPEPEAVVDAHRLAPLQRRLIGFGLSEAQALDASTAYPPTYVTAVLDHVEAELDRGRAVHNVAAFTLAALRDDFRPVEPAVAVRARARRDRGAGDGRGEGGGTSARSPSSRLGKGARNDARPSEAAAQAEARARGDALERDRAIRLDATYAALESGARAALDARALARLQVSLPALHHVYLEAAEAGTPPEQMPVSVRSALRALRHDLVAEQEEERH